MNWSMTLVPVEILQRQRERENDRETKGEHDNEIRGERGGTWAPSRSMGAGGMCRTDGPEPSCRAAPPHQIRAGAVRSFQHNQRSPHCPEDLSQGRSSPLGWGEEEEEEEEEEEKVGACLCYITLLQQRFNLNVVEDGTYECQIQFIQISH